MRAVLVNRYTYHCTGDPSAHEVRVLSALVIKAYCMTTTTRMAMTAGVDCLGMEKAQKKYEYGMGPSKFPGMRVARVGKDGQR